MKLKTSEYFRQRKIIIEREKRENAEIKAAVAAVLGRLMEQRKENKNQKYVFDN